MADVEVEVGRSLDNLGIEFVATWSAAEAGRPVAGDDRIVVRDWTALCAVLTLERYALPRHLRQEPATGIRALARALERDVRRVHADVAALAELGFVMRADDGGLSTAVDAITSTIRVAA